MITLCLGLPNLPGLYHQTFLSKGLQKTCQFIAHITTDILPYADHIIEPIASAR